LIGALALIGIYYTNIYLGYETLLESPGAVPGTLSSWVGVVGLIIPLPRMLQVSNRLPSLYSCSANVSEWNRPHPGSSCPIFDLLCQGVEMAIIAITPDRRVRLVRPFRHLFWYTYARGLRASRAVSFVLTVSVAVDTL